MRPAYKGIFAELALGQNPDVLLIACSDSRVAPNVFASSDPGDALVVRNVGNLVPKPPADESSEGAAIHFAVEEIKVTDIIVCGHSECGAMKALTEGVSAIPDGWLENAASSLERWKQGFRLPGDLTPVNQLSQINVLEQMSHVAAYEPVAARVSRGALRVHGWWFDIANAEVQYFDAKAQRFKVLDEAEVEKLLAGLDTL